MTHKLILQDLADLYQEKKADIPKWIGRYSLEDIHPYHLYKKHIMTSHKQPAGDPSQDPQEAIA